MNVKQLSAVIDGIAPVVKQFVSESVSPLDARVRQIVESADEREVLLKRYVDELFDKRSGEANPEPNASAESQLKEFATCLIERFASDRECV